MFLVHNKLPPELYQALRSELLESDTFGSHEKLIAVFVDSRISDWRDFIPEAQTKADRVARTIDGLVNQTNNKNQNILILLLEVLRDALPAGDAHRDRLRSLTVRLMETQLSSLTEAYESERRHKEEQLASLTETCENDQRHLKEEIDRLRKILVEERQHTENQLTSLKTEKQQAEKQIVATKRRFWLGVAVVLTIAMISVGLVGQFWPRQRPGTIIWPFDRSTLIDFEEEKVPDTWNLDWVQLTHTTEQSFSGRQSLKVTSTITEESPLLVYWQHDFNADLMVVHYYLPSMPEVYVEFLQFCAVLGDVWRCNCQGSTVYNHSRDRWETTIVDLSQCLDNEGKLLSQQNLTAFAVQGVIKARETTSPVSYTMYLDALQFFEDDAH